MPELSISLKIEAREYSRPFAHPLKTARGAWTMRRGTLVRIHSACGRSGYGEIAPLPEFGSETMAEAMDYIGSVPKKLTRRQFKQGLSGAPPATAFGLWSAMSDLDEASDSASSNLKTAGLMSLDDGWKQSLETARSNAVTTFKIKVGIGEQDAERSLLSDILQCLTQDEQVRLDANMSWDPATLSDWSRWLSNTTDKVQYIEEPLQTSLADVQKLNRVASISPVPLALDESLSRHGVSPWIESGWPGYWIIKPSILGVPGWLDQLNPAKVVLSSIFETGIGMRAILSIAQPFELVCHGLGTGTYFDDGLSPLPIDGTIKRPTREEVAGIWRQLS